MKKTYISPEAIFVNLDTECIIALSNGDSVNNSLPSKDDQNNQFSNEYRTSIWGD